MIKFRLRQLMGKLADDTGQKITYRGIQETTGINQNTLVAMGKNTMVQVSLSTIDRLCDYFKCDISDLMVRDEK